MLHLEAAMLLKWKCKPPNTYWKRMDIFPSSIHYYFLQRFPHLLAHEWQEEHGYYTQRAKPVLKITFPALHLANSFLHKIQQSDIKSRFPNTCWWRYTSQVADVCAPQRLFVATLTLFQQSPFFSWMFLAGFCHRNCVLILFSNLLRFSYFRVF